MTTTHWKYKGSNYKPTVPIKRPCKKSKKGIHEFLIDEKPTQKSLENGYWSYCKYCDYKYFYVIQEKSAW